MRKKRRKSKKKANSPAAEAVNEKTPPRENQGIRKAARRRLSDFDDRANTRAFSVPIESERRLYSFI
jgi:hypothetical protein